MTSSARRIGYESESGRDFSTLVEILFGLGVVFLSTCIATLVQIIGLEMQSEVYSSNLIIIYLMGVLVVSCYSGRAGALASAVTSVAAFDFFFVDPRFSLVPRDKEYVVVVVVMLAAALLVNELAMRARANARKAEDARIEAESEKLKNILLRSISHDLKSPLASIIGAASLLTGDDPEVLSQEQREELLASIASESSRLDRVVTNILEITRLESGGLILNREWHMIEEIVGSALAGMGARLSEQDVVLDLAPDLPLVYVDSMLLGQVLVNILDNCLKYAPDSIYRLQAWREGDRLLLEVRNEGEPIDKDKEELVFQKFYRKDGDTRGAGLGLAICRSILTLHEGRIWVVPGIEDGVTIRLALPVTEQTDLPVEAPDHEREAGI
ncbi:MAG: PAS domain-containing sensor histidine kinase [Candidatus Melainabacteria bacterium]|nr:PAS domain-containing sensor histidine kinase [Candidatus Melainabacteria bacterium]